jgi:hypothetical protein
MRCEDPQDFCRKWGMANHDNIATDLTNYETDSFAMKNQASHYLNRMLPKGKRREFPAPPLMSKAQP